VVLSRNRRINDSLPTCARAEQPFVTPSRNAEPGVDVDNAIDSSLRKGLRSELADPHEGW
jgi:hypothetical protein